jgi:hypothetical protein
MITHQLMTPTAYTACRTKPETKYFAETGYVTEKLPTIPIGSKMETHITYFRSVVSSTIRLLWLHGIWQHLIRTGYTKIKFSPSKFCEHNELVEIKQYDSATITSFVTKSILGTLHVTHINFLRSNRPWCLYVRLFSVWWEERQKCMPPSLAVAAILDLSSISYMWPQKYTNTMLFKWHVGKWTQSLTVLARLLLFVFLENRTTCGKSALDIKYLVFL